MHFLVNARNSTLLPMRKMPIKTKLKTETTPDHTGCVPGTFSPPFPTSTGCLSRLSYHWMTLPIRKHHEPQNVAREPWYTQPLLEAAKPRAPHRVKPIPFSAAVNIQVEDFGSLVEREERENDLHLSSSRHRCASPTLLERECTTSSVFPP